MEMIASCASSRIIHCVNYTTCTAPDVARRVPLQRKRPVRLGMMSNKSEGTRRRSALDAGAPVLRKKEPVSERANGHQRTSV